MIFILNNPKPDIIMTNIEEISEINKQETKPLRIALGTGISPQSNIEYYWELIKLIESKVGQKVEVIQKENYADIINLLSMDLVDIAFVCSSSYVIANEESKVVDLLAIPRIDGEYEYYSYIIVRANDGIKNFDDLKGKVFAFSDPLSTSGFFYPSYRLKELGFTADSYFSDYFYTLCHDKSIDAVVKGLADGAAVDSTVYTKIVRDNSDLIQDISVIEKSPKFLNSPMVVRSNLDIKLKNKITNILLELNKDPEAMKVFKKYGIDEFVTVLPDDKSYESVKELIAKVRSK